MFKLKVPEGVENLRGLEVEIKEGFIEVDESEAHRYYQLGFHRVEAEPKPVRQPTGSPSA